MNDDLNKKIKQITEILGQENLPENLKGLLSLLTGSSSGKQDVAVKANEPAAENREEKPDKNESDVNRDLIIKMKRIMDRMNSGSDPRINLLNAIKPFLNNTRQKKLGNCIKLLQVSGLTKIIDEFDKKNS